MVVNNMNQNLIGTHIQHYKDNEDRDRLICDIDNFHNENISASEKMDRCYNGNINYRKLICDIGKFQNESVTIGDQMTYLIGYPSGEVIDIKISQINNLKQEGIIYYERKWDKYAFVDEHKGKVLRKLQSMVPHQTPEEDFLTRGCGLEYSDFKINEDDSVDILTNVDMRNLNMRQIPVSFGIIEGNFDCSDNKLSNLVNAPFLVEGKFICRDNDLFSLIRGPIALKGYYCQNNALQDLEGMVLGDSATEVRVSSNQIAKLKEKDFKILKYVVNLSVDDNILPDLDGISSLQKLEVLNCQRNGMRSSKDICNLTNLEHLFIYDNHLSQIEGLEKLKNLQILSCGNNHLKNLDGIEDLSNLRGLYCEKNSFTERYKTFLKEYCVRKKIKLLV